MAPVHVAQLLAHPAVRSAIERALAARGNRGDSAIVHVDPREEAMLRMMGGVGTINPRTGLRQFYPGDNSNAGEGVGGAGDFGGGVGQGAGFSGSDFSGGGALPGGAPADHGYGKATGGVGASSGSGAGYGGGHTGESGYYSRYGGLPTAPVAAPVAAPAPINNMPLAAPVSLTPMMSDTATTDLAGSRFGALPAWATTPYQIGMAPSSYPTPGVNAALGAPGAGGGGLPGAAGGGLPAGAAGAPGGAPGGIPGLAPGSVVGGVPVGPAGGVLGGAGPSATAAMITSLAKSLGISPQMALGFASGPNMQRQMAAMFGNAPFGGQAMPQQQLPGPAMGQAPRPAAPAPVQRAPVYVPPKPPVRPIAQPLLARPATKAPQSLMQQMAALNAARTIGGQRW